MIFPSTSRLRDTPLTIIDGKETLGVWAKPSFLTSEVPNKYIGSFTVTSNYSGRPDLISQYLYSTPFYDWVLISFNNAQDTLNWPPAGLNIKYPAISIIHAGV